MKRIAILFVCLMALVLTGCSQDNGIPAVAGNTGKTQHSTPTPTQKPDPFEVFKEGKKRGVRKNGVVIADAIWDSIHRYTVDGEEYFTVSLDGTGSGNNRVGLIDEDGNMIIEPSYNYIFHKGGSYFVCSYSGSDTPNDVVEAKTGRVVYQNDNSIDEIVDHYVISHTYKYCEVYHIADIKTGAMLYANPYGNLKDCKKPVYYPGVGFMMEMQQYTTTARKDARSLVAFITLSGKKIESTSIKVDNELGLVFVATDREISRDGYVTLGVNYAVYNQSLTRMGSFTINSQSLDNFFVNSQGHSVIVADAASPVVQPGYVFFDATARTWKDIEGAAKVHAFSDGMAVIRNSENKFGYINDQGDIVYGYQFDDAENFANGQAQAVKNYKKVIIDKKGDDREQVYQQACQLMDQGDYAGAYELFMSIPDYADVKQKLAEKEMILAKKQAAYKPGTTVVFGNYHGNITWIVLEQKDGQVMMISRDLLDYKSSHDYNYNKKADAIWKNTALKNWLNTTFMEEAFSSVQQNQLIDTGIGKVFLLSESELQQHKKLLKDEPKFTDYAESVRKKKNQFIKTPKWLLRNETGDDDYYTTTGYVHKDISNQAYGIRPVIRVPVDALP